MAGLSWELNAMVKGRPVTTGPCSLQRPTRIKLMLHSRCPTLGTVGAVGDTGVVTMFVALVNVVVVVVILVVVVVGGGGGGVVDVVDVVDVVVVVVARLLRLYCCGLAWAWLSSVAHRCATDCSRASRCAWTPPVFVRRVAL